MQVDRQRVVQAFNEYVQDYDLSDGKIALKAEHTLRVAALCDDIAQAQGFCAADQDEAWLIGMLHDIGRFEQVRRWGTFYDSQSVNHGEFGADLLFKDGLIHRFVDDCDPAVEIAIRNHSRYAVDDGLDQRTRAFCDVVRDADKIDILRVNVERPSEEIYGASVGEIFATEVTPAVEQAFFDHRCANRADMRTLIDRKVGHFCFVFGLVYPWSVAQMARQGYLQRAMETPSSNPATEAVLQRMRVEMGSWLAAQGAKAAQ